MTTNESSTFEHNTFVHMDPNKHFRNQNIPISALMESCGFLPSWMINRGEGQTLRQALELNYQQVSGIYEMTGGSVDETGIYHYPEDPDLYPIMQVTDQDETVYIYEYGIIAMLHKGKETFVTRMD